MTELERAIENSRSVWIRLGGLVPNGAVEELDGVTHVATGYPHIFWNATIPTAESGMDRSAVIDSAERFFGPKKLPYTIRFPSNDHDFESACSARGLVKTIPVTFMYAATSVVPVTLRDLVISPVNDSTGLRAVVDIECEAFETDSIRELYTDALFSDGRMSAFLGTVDGEPVGTAGLITSEAGIGIYDVAVVSSHRRRGIAMALVSHAMSVAEEMGFSEISLDTSQMARPLYERLGFHFVGEYTRMQRD